MEIISLRWTALRGSSDILCFGPDQKIKGEYLLSSNRMVIQLTWVIATPTCLSGNDFVTSHLPRQAYGLQCVESFPFGAQSGAYFVLDGFQVRFDWEVFSVFLQMRFTSTLYSFLSKEEF